MCGNYHGWYVRQKDYKVMFVLLFCCLESKRVTGKRDESKWYKMQPTRYMEEYSVNTVHWFVKGQ